MSKSALSGSFRDVAGNRLSTLMLLGDGNGSYGRSRAALGEVPRVKLDVSHSAATSEEEATLSKDVASVE